MDNEINIELYKHPPKFKERIITDKEKDYAYHSEALHSSYLFYTMEVDRLNKQLLAEQAKNKKLVEALEKISNGDRMTYCRSREALLFGCANKDALNINCHSCDYFIAQQALNEVNSNERTRTTKA